MAENAWHNYDVRFTVGDEAEVAKTLLSVYLAACGSTGADGQTELTGAFGAPADLFTPYIVFKTQSEAQAAALAAFLTQEYEAAKTRAQGGPGYMEDALGFAIAMMSAFGNPDMVQFEITNHGNNAIVKIKIADEYSMMMKGMVMQAMDMMAPAMSQKNEIELRLECGASVDALLNAETAVMEFTRFLKLVFKGQVSIAASDTLRGLIPMPEEQKMALNALSAMFREVTLKLAFKDFSNLPQEVQNVVKVADVLAAAPMVLGMVGPENRRLIKDAVAKGAHSFEVDFLTDNHLLKVRMQFPGVEKLLD